MMAMPLRVLIVEDSPDDATLLVRILRKGGFEPSFEVVETEDAMRTALLEKPWDIILSDYRMPAFDGLRALAVLKESGLDIPLIIVSGTIGEEIAVEAMKAGVCDYVMKGNLPRLIPAIKRELKEAVVRDEKKKTERQLRESEQKYRSLVESISDVIFEIDGRGVLTYISPVVRNLFGYEPEDFIGKRFLELVYPEDTDLLVKRFSELTEGIEYPLEYRLVSKLGEVRYVRTYTRPIMKESAFEGARGTIIDITERKIAEQALRESEQASRLLIEKAPVGIGTMQDGVLRNVNPKFLEVFGYDSMHEVLGRPVEEFYSPEERELITQRWKDRLSGKPLPMHYEVKGLKKNGESFDLAVWPTVVDYGGKPAILTYCVDTSEAKSLRHQLLHAQKMEAIGTLAGGIAHDFNNILQVILGYSELLLIKIGETAEGYADVEKINNAVKRGADLVQNLMMFSRKVQPNFRLVNLNDEVVQIQKLLSRTIPKDIKINVHLSGDLELVNADISQIGQVLMNLAVNARDAMPDGGLLNFGTTNVELDVEYCSTHPDFEPRRYVLLAVSDNGVGMSEETASHIFEPFFTTKEIGKGTGLGLATVYGIVKQHKGHITCSSQLGHGTTFTIYLPAIEPALKRDAQESRTPIVGGTETILLVDDEEHVRDLGATILKRYGYEVLAARNGKEGLDIYRTEYGKISLVILDLIMPEMDGKKCLAELLNLNPKAHVLIASGHSESILAMESPLPGARGLVAKPYQMTKLLQAVRDVLDAGILAGKMPALPGTT